MPKTRQQKEEIVKDLTDRLSRAKSVVFADYQGLTMAQLSDLRGKLRDVGSEFTITKNSLLKLALPASSLQLPASSLEGPTGTLFAYEDEAAPIKILVKTLKDATIGSVKAGIFNGEICDRALIERLALLPSHAELMAKMVGSLGAPLYGIVGVLQANLRNLVYALDQIRVQRSAFVPLSGTSARQEGGE